MQTGTITEKKQKAFSFTETCYLQPSRE